MQFLARKSLLVGAALVLRFCCLEVEAGEPVLFVDGVSTNQENLGYSIAPGGDIWTVPVSLPSGANAIRLAAPTSHGSARFGHAVATNGAFIVISAPDRSGSGYGVYVFRNDGDSWLLEDQLFPNTYVDGFGISLDLNGDLLIVGSRSAKAVIFRFDGTTFNLEQEVEIPSAPPTPQNAPAIEDNLAAIVERGSGLTHIFRIVEGIWTLVQTLDPGLVQVMNPSLSMRDGILAVNTDAGVKVYRYDGAAWQFEANMLSSNTPIYRSIYPVAVDGSTLMASFPDQSGGYSVHVYGHEAGTWSLIQELRPIGNSGTSSFGTSIALNGDRAVFGAWLDAGTNGAAWTYRKCAGVWTPEQYFPAPEQNNLSAFGFSASLFGETLVVGAPTENVGDLTHSGAAHVYPASFDCNNNQLADGCERLSPFGDCDDDLVLDECQVFFDCDSNGQRDACDLALGNSDDCNHNSIPDGCDIESAMSLDVDNDSIPDECFELLCDEPSGGAMFSLKATKINNRRIVPTNQVFVRPGDLLESEVYISCWGRDIAEADGFQVGIGIHDGARSGEHGLLLPYGWNAPLTPDWCPCTNPLFPVCSGLYCIGADHAPELGVAIDIDRADFFLYGLLPLVVIDVAATELSPYRWGGVVFGYEGARDIGLARYAGTMLLKPTSDACGNFIYNFFGGPYPQDPCYDSNFLIDRSNASFCPARIESLLIRVCEDDGLFCNGLERCDPDIGCQIISPPSCDDGVECTVDSCDEAVDGCAHALNHTACDDGDVCTRDECTPAGCINIDDQCGAIPAASHWGLAVLALCLLIAAKIRFRPRFA